MAVTPTGVARTFGRDELIVSKTDLKGRITYANDIFLKVSGYTAEEVIGQPHNLIRHPQMPRGVFKLLWDQISTGHEVFAYINNLAKNGDHYWVLAHVTATYNARGTIDGYHSNRRLPTPAAVAQVEELYRRMLAIEAQAGSARAAADAGMRAMNQHFERSGMPYDEFIWSVIDQGRVAA